MKILLKRLFGTDEIENGEKKRSEIKNFAIAFGLAYGAAILIFLPFVIMDGGIFQYYGDYNVQQIPFHIRMVEAIHSGAVKWDWYTDLGANFVGSYSYYLLASPFFLIFTLFPVSWTPYLMAPIMALKFATASGLAYVYIRRFVKNPNYAILGGLMYAFSGFSIVNIFFNQFHDVIAFFPLMLIGMEELINNNKKGIFAVSVAICAALNYFMFVGQVAFLIIYFIIRLSCPDFKINLRKFLWLALESIIGVGLACVIFLPGILGSLNNPRISEPSNGWGFLLYGEVQRYFSIVQTFFFPPDITSFPNFFPDNNAKWASLGLWLPFVGMVGVLSFIKAKSGHWVKKILIVLFIMALVPGLNSAFFLFLNVYYARWFYMFTLMMVLASVIALENTEIDLTFGIKWNTIICAVFSIAIGLIWVKDGEKIKFGVYQLADRFWVYVAITFFCLLAMSFFINQLRKHRHFSRFLIIAVLCTSVFYTINHISYGKEHSWDKKFIVDEGIYGKDKIDLKDDQFFRVDIFDGMENEPMFWDLPTIQAFHTVVPVSIMEFYPKVGVTRDVSSKPETKFYGLRAFLSTKYLFIGTDRNQDYNMTGFEKLNTQNNYNIFKNENFIPMGFTYDNYISETEFEGVSIGDRHLVLTDSMVVSKSDVKKFDGFLQEQKQQDVNYISDVKFEENCALRRENSSHDFSFDNDGFTSKINLKKANYVFFSVPWDEGWSATVNGKKADIEKVNIGFMAVKCSEIGENVIRFDYETPGLSKGFLITIGAFLLLLAYFVFVKVPKGEKEFTIEEHIENEQSDDIIVDDVSDLMRLDGSDTADFDEFEDIPKEDDNDDEEPEEID